LRRHKAIISEYLIVTCQLYQQTKAAMIDLDLRSSKVAKEQEKRRLEAQKKLERERQLKEQQARREQELALEAVRRREEEEAQRARQEAEELADLQLTGGIRCQHTLIPFQIKEESEKNDDKLLLPEECLTELTSQDVFGRGVVIFRVTGTSSLGQTYITYAGIREFSAPAQHVGLPKKVLDCLGGDISQLSSVEVKFVQLPKCTFIKLRPKLNRFFEVIAVKRVLEENLLNHTALAVGDTITVWFRGAAHPMTIMEMKPENQGSLFETDVEVDLDLSEEYQQMQSQAPVAQSSSAGIAPPAAPPTAQQAIESSSSYTLGRADPIALQRQLSNSILHRQKLLPEPEMNENGVLQARIRLPNGKNIVRRFSHNMSLLQIFLAIQHELVLDDATAIKLQLASRFPPRSWAVNEESSLQSLVENGLNAKSDSLIATLLP